MPHSSPGQGCCLVGLLPSALSLNPHCPKTGESILAAATCITLGNKRHVTCISVPKEEPAQGSFLRSPPTVSSPRVMLAVAMGEAVACSQEWVGTVQPWEEVEAMGLSPEFCGRGEFPMEKGQMLLGAFPQWLAMALLEWDR